MYDCFLACTTQSPGFEKIKLTADELEEFRDILGMIDEFRCLQEKTLYVLAQWKQEHMQYSQMNITNRQ